MPGLRNKRVSIAADTKGIEPEKAIRFLKEGDVRVNAICLGYILKADATSEIHIRNAASLLGIK